MITHTLIDITPAALLDIAERMGGCARRATDDH